MKDDRDSCSTGSSLSGIYKNILNKSPTPICMFYFSHPFGISTPSSTNNGGNVESTQPTKKASKYTTTTYLVTEIQKNHSDGSQDEAEPKKRVYTDRELIPWPKNFLLPPLIQLIEKKAGKKLPDVDAILRQVRKQAWNTPKSHRSRNFWSRGSSVSSDDFSSLASPDSLNDKTKPSRGKLRQRSKNTNKPDREAMDATLKSSGTNGSGRRKSELLLKRRYSVPEIIMRKYSLAQQKSYEESTGIQSTTSPMSEAITKSRNGQSSINNHHHQPTPPTAATRTSSPIKYFIPLTPTMSPSTTTPNGFGGGGSFLNNEISMRKQTLLRRMWSREFQHSKYSGSWSPPLRRATHQHQSRLQKFNTLPEVISSSCEKCKELGVLARNFDEESGEAKEDKSQQTDFDSAGDSGTAKADRYASASSGTSSAVVHSADVNDRVNAINNSPPIIDSNGNNVVDCMTAVEGTRIPQPVLQDREDAVEIDSNNNAGVMGNGDKFLRKQFSMQVEDAGNTPTPDINYKRLKEDTVTEAEIDEYISRMLIANLSTVIRTVNENLQANGERNLVKIDFRAAGPGVEECGAGGEESGGGYYNNKFGNQHEISIQMRNARNGDTANNRSQNEPSTPSYAAVERDICGNVDGKSQRSPEADINQHFYGYYGHNKSLSVNSTSTELSDQQELTAIINSGTSYPEPSYPESIYVPRLIGPKTESMEVNPSSSSAQEDDEFDGTVDSEEDDVSDVDSLDDIVTIRAKRLNELAHQQHKKAQALFRQTHLKGQAFFVPIVDSEQQIDEHIVVADAMPERLKEKLVLRQERRKIKKLSDQKVKQLRMQKFIERKIGEVKLIKKMDFIDDFETSGGAFKIIGVPSKKLGAIETAVYKRDADQVATGWKPKERHAPSALAPPSELVSGKPAKSKKLRTEIGMLESYKIDGRGNMQIQNPAAKAAEKVQPKPKVKRTTYTSVSEGKKPVKIKVKTPSEHLPSRKSIASSKRASSNIPTSSASSVEAIDARRRQVMKDVQQMSIYKNDLTPDPDSGPSRKMWKTEIQEGDKHIEILEIVECVDGTSSSSQQMAPEHSFNHHFPPSTSTQNHKYFHLSSSSTHPTIVNKTFSVRTTGYMDGRDSYPSRIPIPVYRYMRSKQPYSHYQARDSSPSNNNYSSSTEEDGSMTSAGSNRQQSSKVDRMIANLLLEALKSPEDLGIDFVRSPKMRKPKRRSLSPAGADSSSTGYYTGDSASRRSASNSAGKYQHRFEVIPEEKSSFSVDSSNDDFDEEEEIARSEKLNDINNDWKSRKNLQNNDIKTRSVTPKQEKENHDDGDGENEKSKTQNNHKLSPSKVSPTKKSPPKTNVKAPPAVKVLKGPSAKSVKSLKSSEQSSSGSQEKKEVVEPTFTSFSENRDSDKSVEGEEASESQAKSIEDAFSHSPHPEHKNLIHQFMTNKSSASSSNNHFHYHLYQYQTHNCCFNMFDPSKTSSTVTTAASNENFSSFHTQSIGNSCQTAEFSQSRNTQNYDDDKSKTAASSKFNENVSRVTSSGSDFPSTIFNTQSRVNFDLSIEADTPSYDESASKSQTAEKVIEVEYLNENYRKPDDDGDDCSCTKKYLPYKVNERNVWQVYETSDCKYIQSKYEVDEVYRPPPSSDGTKTSSEYNPLLHSRSNFSNHIICHAINQDASHSESAQEVEKSESVNSSTPFNLNSTSDSMYTPTFNIKAETVEACQCIDEETEDNASKTIDEDEDEDDNVSVVTAKHFSPSKDPYQMNQQSGKLLNRPKATNNISRDQVKPVEKEIQNELTVTKNGGVQTVKTSKPIRLPSPVPKHQPSPKKSRNYEAQSIQSSDEDFSSDESQRESIKENRRSSKTKSNHNSPRDKTNARQHSSLVRQESKSVVIPNIHQGWSVTVAGTHPDLAPDVEMKLSFPKAKGAIVSTPESSKVDSSKHDKPEVFYYRNNQLLPAPEPSEMPTQMPFDRLDHKPYYNHRRSLSLARIDSGMSGMIKPKTYNLPNLHVPRPTARNAFKVECTTISASKTIIPSRRSLSLDVGNRRLDRRFSLDSRSQASPFTPSEMLSVVGSEIKKTLKPRVKTMSERDLVKRHMNCFTRSNGHF